MSTDESIAEAITDVAPQSAEQDVAERVFVSGLGYVTSTYFEVGRADGNNQHYNLTGLSFGTDQPAVVLLQPRQLDNAYQGYPDQFAVQVITTSKTEILCLVRRLDANAGWGQGLRLDLFAVEQVH